jgi:hypothetical protein
MAVFKTERDGRHDRQAERQECRAPWSDVEALFKRVQDAK